MNKTVTVNIGGIVFHIDENAFERFKLYLESIRSHFTGSEGRDEIMQDIEARIAEMFQERIRDQKQVITLADVEEVTEIMGKPEQFDDIADEVKEENPAGDPNASINIKRRLFRNPDDKFLGGVCSGIAAYFDIDPVWVRLAFVVLSLLGFGTGVVLYIVLWIVIPPALTTTEKLMMKGERVTISSIERNVQEELEQVKKRLNEISDGKQPGNVVSRILDAMLQVIRLIFLFIGKIIAVFLILMGFVMIFILFISILAAIKFPGISYPEVVHQIFPFSYQFGLAFFAGVLVVAIPVIGLAYLGARILFNLRKAPRTVKLSALGLWIAGVIFCGVLAFSLAKEFSQKQSIRKQGEIVQPSSGMLYLTMVKAEVRNKDYERWDENEWNGDLRLSMNGDILESRDIRLDIVESSSNQFELIQILHARGASRKEAEEHAAMIRYNYTQSDTLLSFFPYFLIDKDERYRFQKVQLILGVPKGKKVFLDKSLRGFIWDIKNVENIYDKDMLGRQWEMKENGLSCITCDGTEKSIGKRNKRYSTGIRINDDGIFIENPDEEVISLDSNGVTIRKDGRVRRIPKENIHITIED